MIMGHLGSGLLGRGFGGRLMAAYLDRSGFWSGASQPADPVTGAGDGTIAEGLLAGTLIATDGGWMPVEDLRRGDRIVTFDHGLQPLRRSSRARLISRPEARQGGALVVPAQALGNRRSLLLLPDQAVLMESDRAEALYGDPFTLVPASALEGHAGIRRIDLPSEVEVILLEFENDELVYAEGMVLAHCPRREAVLVSSPDELMQSGSDSVYPLLPPFQARALLAEMAAG